MAGALAGLLDYSKDRDWRVAWTAVQLVDEKVDGMARSLAAWTVDHRVAEKGVWSVARMERNGADTMAAVMVDRSVIEKGSWWEPAAAAWSGTSRGMQSGDKLAGWSELLKAAT